MNPINWEKIPENIRTSIFRHFFDENDTPIQTISQYHKETMTEHVNMVYQNFRKLIFNYNLTDDQVSFALWSVLLHDIAKPDTIVEKQRKICPNCHRPNVPAWEARVIKKCIHCNSDQLSINNDKWQICNDCGKWSPKVSEARDNTNCYVCKADLPEESILQHGWHGHDFKGAEPEYLNPVLDQIGIEGEDRDKMMAMIRYHSLVHALMHFALKTNRAEADGNKQSGWMSSRARNIDTYGFDPFEMPFEQALSKLFDGNKTMMLIAVLLSYADNHGKESDIIEDSFDEEFLNDLVERIV